MPFLFDFKCKTFKRIKKIIVGYSGKLLLNSLENSLFLKNNTLG